jgi:hypothetical protein
MRNIYVVCAELAATRALQMLNNRHSKVPCADNSSQTFNKQPHRRQK